MAFINVRKFLSAPGYWGLNMNFAIVKGGFFLVGNKSDSL